MLASDLWLHYSFWYIWYGKWLFNPIQVEGGGGKKTPPTIFSPVASTIVGINPLNFLTLSFNPFATLVKNFKSIPTASPKVLNLNQDYTSKKCFFWLNPYKVEFMIISVIEMLELPNFDHMTTYKI